jgi:hypothetical protein
MIPITPNDIDNKTMFFSSLFSIVVILKCVIDLFFEIGKITHNDTSN